RRSGTDESVAAPRRPRGRSYDEDRRWRGLGTLGMGLAIGVAIGAGLALLTAPMSGAETRELIGRRSRRIRGRASDRWDDLRDGLRLAARRSRRGIRRGMTRGKWAWQDVTD
ncbi:MAG TPA: YtxH domain-containing protein, partial [Gemmatimonadaceae bacterium]|nr:YtxH domain-containing protein [Gemmatimonadaceae bacterium]